MESIGKTTKYNFLILSDIHYIKEKLDDTIDYSFTKAAVFRNTFQNYLLEEINKKRKTINYILISGDLTFSGKYDQFIEFWDWILEIVKI